jgi:hypothetical protein
MEEYVTRTREYSNETRAYCIGSQLWNFAPERPHLLQLEWETRRRGRGANPLQIGTRISVPNHETIAPRNRAQSQFLQF